MTEDAPTDTNEEDLSQTPFDHFKKLLETHTKANAAQLTTTLTNYKNEIDSITKPLIERQDAVDARVQGIEAQVQENTKLFEEINKNA